MRIQADDHHPQMVSALNQLLDSGGKRIRPALVLLTGGMLGTDIEKLVLLAAAVELLHTATLVHDDLIDGSLIRRGYPTLNAKWTAAATVLTGDFLFAQAANLAADTESPAMLHLFAQTLATIVNGEVTQMFSGRGHTDRQDYYRRIYAKTASLFETSTTAVAILSKSPSEIKEKIRRYGYEVGMAFQIMDDILDFTGEQATLGKPVASDLRQGLITLPSLYYIEAHSDDLNMKNVLASDPCEESCIQKLLISIRESGAIERSQAEADQHIDRALEALVGLPDCVEQRSLEDLAKYIIRRNM